MSKHVLLSAKTNISLMFILQFTNCTTFLFIRISRIQLNNDNIYNKAKLKKVEGRMRSTLYIERRFSI
jgi:hypothetical protein